MPVDRANVDRAAGPPAWTVHVQPRRAGLIAQRIVGDHRAPRPAASVRYTVRRRAWLLPVRPSWPRHWKGLVPSRSFPLLASIGRSEEHTSELQSHLNL